MEMNPYIVYVKLDDANRITAVNSSAFLSNTDGWTEIDNGHGDKYHHAQGNYFPKAIRDVCGMCLYKLEDGKPVERTQEEMELDYSSIEKVQSIDELELLLEIAADHEYRICLMELGVNENDL